MILSVVYNGGWRYAEAWDEMSQVIQEVMCGLHSEVEEGRSYSPGDDAWFSFAGERHSDENRVADNHLRLAVNHRTGYGSLVWFVNDKSPKKGGIYDPVWVSDNPEPPDFDPRVVSDPGYPLFHDPASTLPITQVRAAVEEFCRKGTGERPECINWVPGEMNGQRYDRPPIMDFKEDPEIDWESLK
ncbi:Imm1 family immunity protein [Streptomyces sp. NPDC093228]|uniref:Imm1 family immunity protein n=1 Tax=Streptomyces sp. NPDC093228 TaxID=3155070 RepID=UPI003435F405